MEYLSAYCIKNQPAKMDLEDLKRQSLTQTLCQSKLGASIGQGAAETLTFLVKTHVESREHCPPISIS